MAKKKLAVAAPAPATGAPARPAAQADTAAAFRPGAEPAGGSGPAALVAAALALAPAVGVPHELMLQDTLKSTVVSFGVLAAAAWFFWQQRHGSGSLRWHGVLWLPLLLMAHALGSMAWSHAYLGGVEAVRWFIFALLLWLGLNTFARERLPWVALGIHLGAVVAAAWAVPQFLTGASLFPQGPNPASTFVNRNFFAEFVVCALPFSVLLLARARQTATIALLAASTGLVLAALLMTGTRSALIALGLQLVLVLPLAAWRCRGRLAASGWSTGSRVLAAGVLLGTVGGLGLLPSGNERILAEERGRTAFERTLNRAQSIGPGDTSLNIRQDMWKATLDVIAARPLTGVGAGAWEVEVPRYQRASLETDYYAHNEVLQLLAEYGLAGAVVLAGLLAYLLGAAWCTWRDRRPAAEEEAPWRAAALASILSLLVVSNVGFPWRMAATGALFAAALAVLAASDARLHAGRWSARVLAWKPSWAVGGLAGTGAALLLAAYITHQAALAEEKIVQATRIAMMITRAGGPGQPATQKAKAEMLQLVREGIAINPHYRKITPIVADELARWGDWANAMWIWDSVLQSRPYVATILTNMAKGHVALNQPQQALDYLARAEAIAPDGPSVRTLQVVMLTRYGNDDARAAALVNDAIARGRHDQDLLRMGFELGWRMGDRALVERCAELLVRDHPAQRPDHLLMLADYYAKEARETDRALELYRHALDTAQPERRPQLLARVPAELRARLRP